MNEDFNFDINAGSPITKGGNIVFKTPKAAKGGVFAPADYELIQNALNYYLRQDLGNKEVAQIANLLHRIRSRV